MTFSMTKREAELLAFIRDSISANGVAPSFDEMMERMCLVSKSSVHRLLTGLERRGHITRLKGCARAIQVVDGCRCPMCNYHTAQREVDQQMAAA